MGWIGASASPTRGGAAQRRAQNQVDITEESLKSPSMLKDTQASKRTKVRPGHSPATDAASVVNRGGVAAGLGRGADRTNPFRFIEDALNEAKAKIEKMKATPQILESLPDVS